MEELRLVLHEWLHSRYSIVCTNRSSHIDTTADDHIINFLEIHMLNLILLGYRIEPCAFYQTIILVFSGLDDFLYKINAARSIDINDSHPTYFSLTPCASIVPLKLRTKILFAFHKGPFGICQFS